MGIGDGGLGIGDWGLGIGDWDQSHIPPSPNPNPHPQKFFYFKIIFNNKNGILYKDINFI